ncbi:unnamed protein product [Coccothraustes coccothraustes]
MEGAGLNTSVRRARGARLWSRGRSRLEMRAGMCGSRTLRLRRCCCCRRLPAGTVPHLLPGTARLGRAAQKHRRRSRHALDLTHPLSAQALEGLGDGRTTIHGGCNKVRTTA